jgi:hypothetical protein
MKIWLTGILVFVLGAGTYYYFRIYLADVEKVESPPPLVESTPAITEPSAPDEDVTDYVASEPEEYESSPVVEPRTLPMLSESDPLVLESAAQLVGEATVMQNMVSEGLVSRLVATIDSLTSAQVPGIIIPLNPVGGEFEATADESPEFAQTTPDGDPIPQYVLDPVNYRRYDSYAETLESLDIEELVANYHQLYPLFQEAYRELGYSDGDFTGRLVAVIDEMLATPEPSDPVRLIRTEAIFQFRDPELERLSAGQKLLIRMGPANASRVKAQLRTLRAALVNS